MGYSNDVLRRLKEHNAGRGAKLTQIANERGIKYVLVRLWHGARDDERKLKNRHESNRMCPICKPDNKYAMNNEYWRYKS